jgi:hypothetical protein
VLDNTPSPSEGNMTTNDLTPLERQILNASAPAVSRWLFHKSKKATGRRSIPPLQTSLKYLVKRKRLSN